MALDLELSWSLRDKVATLIDQGKPHMKEASTAKYFCCESAIKAAVMTVTRGAVYMPGSPPRSRLEGTYLFPSASSCGC